MIDLVHNRHTGFALVHDEDSLAGARRAMIGRDGEVRLIESSGRLRRLARRIPADLAREMRGCAAMPLIRVRGLHAVETGSIEIFTAA
jgi:hypothetical protein